MGCGRKTEKAEKVDAIRAAARNARNGGDITLASLLEAIAESTEKFNHANGNVTTGEQWRWSPVVHRALAIARDRGIR